MRAVCEKGCLGQVRVKDRLTSIWLTLGVGRLAASRASRWAIPLRVGRAVVVECRRRAGFKRRKCR